VKNSIWKFETTVDRFFDIHRYIKTTCDVIFYDTINDKQEKVGYLKDGILCIKRGYQWDGCTPKFMFFKYIVGVPDFKKTKEASLVHDFLIEFYNQHLISRKNIDIIFSKILKEKKFKLRYLYANVVHFYRIVFFKDKRD